MRGITPSITSFWSGRPTAAAEDENSHFQPSHIRSFDPLVSSESSLRFTSTDPWRFLKRLPHKLLRDIGMVISSPSLLVDSLELPMVCPDLLGGGSENWYESVKWLSTVEVDHVKQWFKEKRNNRRLGDHFAFCVEYILLFSPVARVKSLLASQQVTHREDFGSCHETIKFKTPKCRVVLSDLMMERIGRDVFINLFFGRSYEKSQSPTRKDKEDIDGDETTEIEKNIITNTEEFMHKEVGTVNESKKTISKKQSRNLRDGKSRVLTIGEFDFLFEEENAAKDIPVICPRKSGVSSEDHELYEVTRIYHWEVSVKFLLYAGPWEIFGIKTPCHAAWKSSSNEVPLEVAPEYANSSFEGQGITREVECPVQEAFHTNEFLGCFLGPHVGETLYDRKARLMKQIGLAENEHGASMLWKLFVPSSMGHYQKPDNHIDKKDAKRLQVSPRALLKGYLFYEYELWCHLCHQKYGPESAYKKHPNTYFNGDTKAKFNEDHWMGWWTRCSGFLEFAHLPRHDGSKWYIVPKLEWLSPVVIEQGEEERIYQLLSIDEFLVVADKVQEEAERSNAPRKMRFMLAEMVQDNGVWTEFSRGFIVEDTWPDSRLYRPHGYNLSWPLIM